MKKLGLCMIVKDEAENIPKLGQLPPALFDQIVIVDTGSTDATLNLLQQLQTSLPLEIHQHPWQQDFAQARNLAFARMQTEMILWLDADDELPTGTLNFLSELKLKPSGELSGSYLFDYIYTEGQTPTLTLKRANLIRRDNFSHWNYRVYEQLILKDDTPVTLLLSIIHRVKPELTPQKKERYLTILQAMLKDPAQAAHAHHFLGLHYLELNQLTEAKAQLKALLTHEPHHIAGRLHLLQILLNENNTAEFEAEFERLKSRGLNIPVLLPLKAFWFELQGLKTEAVELLEKARTWDEAEQYWLSKEHTFYWCQIYSSRKLIQLYRELNQTAKIVELKKFLLSRGF